MLPIWWAAIRPKTLFASIGPIILGAALAASQHSISLSLLLVALLCGVSLQISVNLTNDYFDSMSGVDSDQRLGPQRVTHSGLVSQVQIKRATGLTVLVAVVSGLVLVANAGWPLFVAGCAALLAVYAYSGGPYPLASHGLGELAVLVFFGWLAVAGSYYLFTHQWSWLAFHYGTVTGIFSAAIMLVNNIRDIPTDTPAGKLTLAVRLGDRAARLLYQFMIFGGLLLHLVVATATGWLALLPVVVCLPLAWHLRQAIKHLQGKALNGLLAKTSLFNLLYCLTASAALLL